MLLEFGCTNHRSIRDKVVFSMLAGTDETFQEQLAQAGKYRVLRSAAIYGANGSGKTNFIEAIRFVRDMVKESVKNQPGEALLQAPHKLATAETPSEYDVKFVVDGVRYAYGFSVKEQRIRNEYLYHFPHGRQARIFERKDMHVAPGSHFKSSFDLSLSTLTENRLFLSCAANYSRVRPVEDAYRFFAQDLVIYNPAFDSRMECALTTLHENQAMKQALLSLLQALGAEVKDVDIEIETGRISDTGGGTHLPDTLRGVTTMQQVNKFAARVIYDGMETDLLTEESAGMQRLFETLCTVLDVLNRGRVLIWDGLKAHLHEAIVRKILRMFQQTRRDEFAQMIFTTHDSSLLNAGLFRRDQIWFTELDEHRATDLYSLAEIKDVRRRENLEKGYISGRYGGVPMVDRSNCERLADSTAAL